MTGKQERSSVLLGIIKQGGFGGVWSLCNLATPYPESDMKDAFPEAKGKKEITMKTTDRDDMEEFK